MATEFQTEQDRSVTTLVTGIVDDAQQLFAQQMHLFQVELKHDIQRVAMAFVPLIVGIVIIMTGLLMLVFATGHFVQWLFPDLPLWGAYGIVGVSVIVLGIILLFVSKAVLGNPLPEQSLQGLKENFQWKTKT
jgi:uncharacterized membrane protein